MIRFSKCFIAVCSFATMMLTTGFAEPILTTSDRLVVGQNGIYVHTSDGLLPVSTVTETQNGQMVVVPKPASECEAIEWMCCRCGTLNTGEGACSVCGWPLYSDEDI